jgi:hypothetical protein
MFDNKWVKSWDLGGRDITVTIVRVEAGVLENKRANKKDKAPIVWFKGGKKPLGLNRTNAKTIAAMYGNDTKDWIGKSVTLYPTQTQFGNDTVDCIRIRPQAPRGKAQDMPNPEPPADGAPERCETGTCGECAFCIAAAKDERAANGEATP